MCHWKRTFLLRSHVGDHSLCGVYTYATFSSWISTLRTAHIHEKRGSFEGGQFPFNASVAFSWRRFIMFIQGFVGSKGYCSKFKSLRLWDETWGLCNMPRTPLISSLISCPNSSSSGLANSWHSSITDSSQTTIRFPPRPDDCLSWFCWIKMSILLQPTLWAGAATYKTCSAHHNLTSLAHAHLHVCVHAVHVWIIHQHTRKFKTSFKTYMHTYTCTCPRPCTWNKYHISFSNQVL